MGLMSSATASGGPSAGGGGRKGVGPAGGGGGGGGGARELPLFPSDAKARRGSLLFTGTGHAVQEPLLVQQRHAEARRLARCLVKFTKKTFF